MSGGILELKQTWQISGYFAASSWLIGVWDYFIRLDNEVAFIWPMAPTFYIKWLYLFAQYFTLAAQTAVFGIQVLYLSNRPISSDGCRVFRALQMSVIMLLMLCFDVVLLLRIYALYRRHTWNCFIATCAVLTEFITTTVSVALTTSKVMYDSACIMITVPRTTIVFVIGASTSQTILMWLAYRKRERTIRSRASIACVTIRDGTLVFVCIALFLGSIFVAILRENPATSLVSYWVPTFISISTCRIILNLQTTPHAHVEPTQQFTTGFLELDAGVDSIFLASLSSRSRP